MHTSAPLPSFDLHGYLPPGIHETDWETVRDRFVFNDRRIKLWGQFEAFLREKVPADNFSCVYLDGGFISGKVAPTDIDVIVQPRSPFGCDAFRAVESLMPRVDALYDQYGVHLHFWFEGHPETACDFRSFFQYLRPQDAAPLGLKEGARKGIVRVLL